MAADRGPASGIRRTWAALALLLIAMVALVLLSHQKQPDILAHVLVLAGSAAAITALLWRAPITNRWFVFGGALAAHIITLAGLPAFEDDYYRFIWDGWQIWQTGTPYGVAPDFFFADESVPPALRTVLDGVNNPEYPTIYGPALQLVFAGIFALSGSDFIGLQLIFAATNLVIIALLMRRHAPGAVALYAWNPLVIAETGLHLHADGLLAAALLAALTAGRKQVIAAGILFGLAAGVKLVALAAWPMLLRLRPPALIAAMATLGLLYLIFLVQGQGVGFDSTASFATLWHFNPLLYEPFFQLLGGQAGRIAVAVIAGLLVLWLHARSRSIGHVPLAGIFGIILVFAPAVNAWYLLWLLPFAVGRGQVWPYAATVALPFSYLTGLNLDDQALEAFAVHPLARAAEAAILLFGLAYDWRTHRRHRRAVADPSATPIANPAIAVVIPALNEEASVAAVIAGIRHALPGTLAQVILVDNGSTDNTAKVAHGAGATIVTEMQRGYGAACLAGIARLDAQVDIVLFIDADGSDILTDAPTIVAPIITGSADLVIGARTSGRIERGAMTVPQRFGNWLAPLLVRLIWGVRYNDLGPFRAIRRTSLDALAMEDRGFGWTIEMQVRAAKQGMRTIEVATGYRRRIGVSKISGTIDGVFKAGSKILFVIAREAFGNFDRS